MPLSLVTYWRLILTVESFFAPSSHCLHSFFDSLSISWSQSCPCLHNSWSRSFAIRMKGTRKPSGSNTDAVVLSNPLLVRGLSFSWIVKVNMSVTVSHAIPRARSMFSVSISRVADEDTSPLGRAARTSLSLLRNLVSLNPPRESIDARSLASLMATTGDSTDFSRSST